jgi:hydrogenase nickel incorporation protein HypA/HybF
MHELAVTQSVLAVALEAAAKADARRITAIDLVIGEISGFIDDSVQFYFDILSRGTPAEGALLRFDRRPATATCRDCGSTYPVTLPLTPFCTACGGAHLAIAGGREMRIESIEVALDRREGVDDENTG